jgi:uncharacterized protein YdeI (YjbR/CyaY-like superfamily)
VRKREDPPRTFASRAKLRAWLERNHARTAELNLRLFKVHARERGVTYREALDEALCFGWIDGIRRKYGEDAYGNRFTPRRPGSNWSAININRVEELTRAKRMQPAGLAAFARRTEAKSRVYTYEQNDVLPLDKTIEKQFKANKKAWDFFQGQAPYYRKLMTRWLNSAKAEETRLRRLAKLVAACDQGKRM